jgi:hypothetical protein
VTALKHATRTIPIVFVSVSDPIGSAFIANMARPGGNITGFTILNARIAGKYVSMLKEMVVQAERRAGLALSLPIRSRFLRAKPAEWTGRDKRDAAVVDFWRADRRNHPGKMDAE